jgi:Flp pilus assembly protein TadB
LTLQKKYVILFARGGGYIYAIIFITISILLSYNFFSIYFINKKSKYVYLKKIKFNSYIKKTFFKKYLYKTQEKLLNLGNPFGFTVRRYFVFKYLISTFVFFIIFFRTSNIFISILYFLIFYKLPDILVLTYKKQENIKIINDISNIVQSVILSLSANMSLYESLKLSLENISYKRFKLEYENFVNDYIMYNFNILKAINEFENKFNSYEFNMFLSILIQGEKEGKLLENLEIFNSSLELMYFKYLKYKESQRIIFVSFATVISVINSFIIVMYPIGVQITQNLSEIFK